MIFRFALDRLDGDAQRTKARKKNILNCESFLF